MKNGTYTAKSKATDRSLKVNLSNGMAYFKNGNVSAQQPLSTFLNHYTVVQRESASGGLYDLVRVSGGVVQEVLERGKSYSICAYKRSQAGAYGKYQIRKVV